MTSRSLTVDISGSVSKWPGHAHTGLQEGPVALRDRSVQAQGRPGRGAVFGKEDLECDKNVEYSILKEKDGKSIHQHTGAVYGITAQCR